MGKFSVSGNQHPSKSVASILRYGSARGHLMQSLKDFPGASSPAFVDIFFFFFFEGLPSSRAWEIPVVPLFPCPLATVIEIEHHDFGF